LAPRPLTRLARRGATQDVAAADEGLGAHKTHLTYRWNKFIQRRRELEARRATASPLRRCAQAPAR
jgi:hypothetical protein